MLTAILVAALLLSGGQGFAAPGDGDLYSYEDLTADVKELATTHPDLVAYRSVGQSVYGREIWALRVGHGPAAVLLNGAHHAPEWVTAPLLMDLAREYAGSGAPELEGVSLWVVPMVSPDGVTLQQRGAAAFPPEARLGLLALNGGSRTLADQLAGLTGYGLVPPEENPSGGGYKDWFEVEYGRPGFTVEVGGYGDGAPLTLAALPGELERNRGVPLWAARAGLELWLERNRVAVYLEEEPVQDGVLLDGRTYVPLRTTAEALGWTVVWREEDRSVHLHTREDAEAPSSFRSRRLTSYFS